MRERHNSIPSLDGLIDPLLAAAIDDAATSAAMPPAVVDLKSLPARPDSPPRPTFDDSEQNPTTNPETPPSTATSSAAASVSSAPTLTKRQHALHEILSSERAYASDLALIRDVHIPLALGLSVPLTNIPSPPTSSSSGSSSRTHSTASDSSTASLGPPMTQDDTKIIFGNVTELALFADMFSEELELALGAVVEGGEGEDTVGALFLRIIPDLERPYKHYITRHPTALQHLHSLPQTPALTAYLTHTQTIASALSHAWDLASLLIKPVQRLLKRTCVWHVLGWRRSLGT
ncbi:hypothetical protein NLJ89_g11922 [Agrocybe chaxingu]|uniref:DH domain-containing protein n=1 Tax=Agrocybe chaxingu TaxID=84603 RepID=A0A9W8MNZ1_9AGAR|nr:hypothetical protein NLJ89_g11922 [Agrocybe chaxingu]